MNLFITNIVDRPWFFFAWVIIVVFSVCAHEFSHALAARRCGDDTAAENGHLSFNPMIQMGINSLIVLAMFGIAWGAVPVDVSRMRKTWHAAAVAFAGPAANLVLCMVAAFLSVLFSLGKDPEATSMVSQFFAFASVANGVLFLFNLLPVPMFDGWTVFSLFVPAMRRVEPQQAQTIGWVFLLVVFVTPVGGLVWEAGSWIGFACIAGWHGVLALVGLG